MKEPNIDRCLENPLDFAPLGNFRLAFTVEAGGDRA
jgi:hypothetical protein